MDPEAFLDMANQVIKLKMFPYFDIAHCVLCALHVREDLGPGKLAVSKFIMLFTRGHLRTPRPSREIELLAASLIPETNHVPRSAAMFYIYGRDLSLSVFSFPLSLSFSLAFSLSFVGLPPRKRNIIAARFLGIQKIFDILSLSLSRDKVRIFQ